MSPELIGIVAVGVALAGVVLVSIRALRAETNERFKELRAETNERFGELRAEMDARFEKVDARFDKVDARFDKVDGDIAELRERMARVEGVVEGYSRQGSRTAA